MKCGVPQGSILGPLLFNMYLSEIGKVAQKHNMNRKSFADDNQLHQAFIPKNITEKTLTVANIKNCTTDLEIFFGQHFMKFNGVKTDGLISGTKEKLKEVNLNEIPVGSSMIEPSNHVKNLGVYFDKEMTMEKQIQHIQMKCYSQLRRISRIRNSLNEKATKTLVHQLVISHLDYGNALLYGITEEKMNKLQKIQNSAARLICKIKI